MNLISFERITGHEVTQQPVGGMVSVQVLCDCNGEGALFYATDKDLDSALRKLRDLVYRHHTMIVFERQKWCCCDCGRRRGLDPDHIQLRSHSRLDTVQNLKGRCRECHDIRHGKRVRPADGKAAR